MSGVGSFIYNLLLTVHIVAVVAAFGPPLIVTRALKLAREQGGAAGVKTANLAAFAFNKISLPAAIGAVVVGVLLVVVSDGAWSFSQPWISAAFTVILLLVLIGFFVVAPAIKKTIGQIETPGSDEEVGSVKASLAMGTGFYHLGLIIIVVLMIWKPGA